MLRVENLNVSYGGIAALRNVCIEVGEGEAVAVIGANGAGKSTLLKTISGMKKASSGRITFNGRPLPPAPHLVVAAGVAHVPEGRRIFPDLTVLENLRVGAIQRKDRRAVESDIQFIFQMFPRLGERQNQFGGLLSGGEQQMLAIGRGLMARPKLLLLDEPSLGLAPIIVNQIFETLETVKKSGTTLLLVEQNAYKALRLAGRAYVFASGQVVRHGPSSELLSSADLSAAYLGADDSGGEGPGDGGKAEGRVAI